MNQRLIRAAIAFYPADWRRRYGLELEQLIDDACATAQSQRVMELRLAVGVAGAGIRERMRDRGVGRKHRIAGVVATAVVATAAVIVVMGSSQIRAKAPTPSPVTLAPGAHLGPAVRQVDETALHGALGLQHVLIRMNHLSHTVDSVEGLPSLVNLNPKTEQVTSVRPAGER